MKTFLFWGKIWAQKMVIPSQNRKLWFCMMFMLWIYCNNFVSKINVIGINFTIICPNFARFWNLFEVLLIFLLAFEKVSILGQNLGTNKRSSNNFLRYPLRCPHHMNFKEISHFNKRQNTDSVLRIRIDVSTIMFKMVYLIHS